MGSRWYCVAFAIVLIPVLAVARPGLISGLVIGEDGITVPYANVIIVGSTIGAMTYFDGRFRLEAPPGKHRLKIMAMGRSSEERDVEVREGETIRMTAMLGEVPGGMKVVVGDGESRNGVKVDAMRQWHYPAKSAPVQRGQIEFCLRYCIADQGDSVLVNVIAAGTNVGVGPVTVCGCFTLWCSYEMSMDLWMEKVPIHGSFDGKIPKPIIRQPCDCYPHASRLHCAPEVLHPGASAARGIALAFSRAEFSFWTGDLTVRGFYQSGHDGDGWDDIDDSVLIGEIVVPIRPIGQPMRTP